MTAAIKNGERRAIPRPANDPYPEVVVGGPKTACVGREAMAAMMVDDCFKVRRGQRAPKLVFASNGHAIAFAATNARFREVFETADIIHADGQPVVMGSRLAGTPIPERSATTDFIHDACNAAQKSGLSIFLLGATEDVNTRCAEVLQAQYPGLRIAGRRNGYFKGEDEAALCEEINASGADILFVGLSVPFEYEFCVRNKARIKSGWVVTCGGCYNFVTGDYSRAPAWMQKHSLEWLYRLAREPKRLFWRYMITNPAAMALIVFNSYGLKKKPDPLAPEGGDVVVLGTRRAS